MFATIFPPLDLKEMQQPHMWTWSAPTVLTLQSQSWTGSSCTWK